MGPIPTHSSNTGICSVSSCAKIEYYKISYILLFVTWLVPKHWEEIQVKLMEEKSKKTDFSVLS